MKMLWDMEQVHCGICVTGIIQGDLLSEGLVRTNTREPNQGFNVRKVIFVVQFLPQLHEKYVTFPVWIAHK